MAPTETVPVDTAAEGYLRLLGHLGVEHFINSPGSDDGPFWEALAKLDAEAEAVGEAPAITHVNCRHEATAVAMAKAHAQLTGRPQAVKLHVNTGPLHAAMELYGANLAGIPLILLSSYDSTHEGELPGGTSGAHYLNFQQPGGHENHLYRYMKWVTSFDTNANGERILARAYRIATSYPQGPVFVNIAEEHLYDEDTGSVRLHSLAPAEPPGLSAGAVDHVVDRLRSAAAPLIITGRLGPDRAARGDLRTVAEALSVPVFEQEKWAYCFPMDHPLYLGASAGGEPSATPYFEQGVDLVVAIGSTRPWYPPAGGAPADAEVIMVNGEPLQTKQRYWNYPADRVFTADPAAALADLAAAVEGTGLDRSSPLTRAGGRWADRVADGAEAEPIDPFWLCAQLDATLPDDAVVVNETIVHRGIVANVVTDAGDRRYLSATKANGGGLGSGLGTALGVALAEPDRTPVLLVGDGSFNYNPVVAAFGAAAEYGLPFLAVIFDNRGYRSMRANLARNFPAGYAAQRDTYYGSAITPTPDYATLAEAWGGVGEQVTQPGAIAEAVGRGLAAVDEGRVAVLDVLLEEEPPSVPAHA